MFPSLLALALAASIPQDAGTTLRSDAVCAAEPSAYARSGEARLAYRDLGPSDGRPVLLIAGTDQQMTQWPASLIETMQARGLRPIVYDARDVGCSTHHTAAGPANWGEIITALAAGRRPALAYNLETLAGDAVAVLDDLGVARSDVLGVSGGATVAGEMAAAAPERVGRLVLVMANSGNPSLPMPADPARLAALPPPPAAGAAPETVSAYRTAAWTAMDGDEAPGDPRAYPEMADRATARSWDPDGIGRAGAALLAAGDRRARLGELAAPTLVVHGEADPLVSAAAGREVAQAIPEARFVLIPRMGHSLTAAAERAIVDGLTEPGAGPGRDE